jgi:hypothetical protein
MILDSEYYSNFSSYLYALLTCALACFVWLLFNKIRASMPSNKIENPTNYASRLPNFGKDTDESTKAETKREEKTEICTSLSCIRCSKSVYSVEKLLTKWSIIEQQFKTDQNTKNRIRNGILNTSKRLEMYETNQQEPTLFYLEGLPSQIWYNSHMYASEVSILENRSTFDVFKREFMNVYQDLNIGWVANKVPSGGWYLFYLINQGVKNEQNCLKCPRIVETIEGLTSAMLDCAFGNVVFSVLLPGTSIARHCGPTNVRIRCHVPLQVPRGYYISVAGEQQTWREGKTLVFDDSFYHEVYCYGNINEPRVVLMIDLWHPSLLLREQEMIKKLFSPQQ